MTPPAMLAAMAGHALEPAAPGTRVAVVDELVTARNRPEVLAAFEAWLSGFRLASASRSSHVSDPGRARRPWRPT